jgi:hypothetical protein
MLPASGLDSSKRSKKDCSERCVGLPHATARVNGATMNARVDVRAMEGMSEVLSRLVVKRTIPRFCRGAMKCSARATSGGFRATSGRAAKSLAASRHELHEIARRFVHDRLKSEQRTERAHAHELAPREDGSVRWRGCFSGRREQRMNTEVAVRCNAEVPHNDGRAFRKGHSSHMRVSRIDRIC